VPNGYSTLDLGGHYCIGSSFAMMDRIAFELTNVPEIPGISEVDGVFQYWFSYSFRSQSTRAAERCG
jgi:hypothetical protein